MDMRGAIIFEKVPCSCSSCSENKSVAESWMDENDFTQVMCVTRGCIHRGTRLFAKGDSQKLREKCSCGNFRKQLEVHEWDGYPVFDCKNCKVTAPFLSATQTLVRVGVESTVCSGFSCPFCRSDDGKFVALVPRQVADEMLTKAAQSLCDAVIARKKQVAKLFDRKQ